MALYVGVAKRLLARLHEHNVDNQRGTRYTRGRRSVTLSAAYHCADRRAATGLERLVKRLSRSWKAAVPGAVGWLTAPEALALATAEAEADSAGPAPIDVPPPGITRAPA